MGPSRTLDTDFVFTVSDNSHSSDSENGIQSRTAAKRKRKRAGATNSRRKKQKFNEDTPSSEEGEVGVEEESDGYMNSEFEFDLGDDTTEFRDFVKDFDGWGGQPVRQESNKRAVDIDSIVSRRTAKKAGETTLVLQSGEDDTEASSEEETDNSDEGEDEEAFADLRSVVDSDGDGGEVESEGSDSDSVAFPVAHPNDIRSEKSDDEESQASDSDAENTAKKAAFFAQDVEGKDTKNDTGKSFQQFHLSRPILRALTTINWNDPTPIQTRTIPLALAGHDIVGSAVTGSGKTAAFLLPILERLLYRPRKIPATRVAILLPTRELAVQCATVTVSLCKYTDITVAQIVGGFSLKEQAAVLKKRPDIVIATPGRFIDHARNTASFSIESIEILVLDEADRMLEAGFADELDEIIRMIPRSRQTMLFSATMTERIDTLIRMGMNRPVRVSVDAKRATTSGLTQEFVRLRHGKENLRLALLCFLCMNVFKKRVIIFFRQKRDAHRIRVLFALLGIKAGELHGSLTQEQRIDAVNDFKDGNITHLLATDLASRGLDIKNVLTVINYEAPQSHEIYLHRVGRTARAGREGRSCTIAAESDRRIVKAAVKSSRSQNAKVISRPLEREAVEAMHKRIEELEEEIEEVLKEEKQEKDMAQMEMQITRGENLVKHEADIKSQPRRTWFETGKEKKAAKERGKMELNGVEVQIKPEKKQRLSNKAKKLLDAKRERKEGRQSQKVKGSEAAVKAQQAERKRVKRVAKIQKRK